MKINRGFSLLELLIVVAIILIIATIAVPALLKSRQAANQSHAVANLRTLNTGEVSYLSNHQGQYGAIPELITAGLLDFRYAQSSAGYNFDVQLSPDYLNYTATATAQGANAGRYDFYRDRTMSFATRLIPRGHRRDSRVNPSINRITGARALVVCAVLAAVCYANSLSNAFILDDVLIIAANERIRHIEPLHIWVQSYWGDLNHAGIYRPLTIFSFSLEYPIWHVWALGSVWSISRFMP